MLAFRFLAPAEKDAREAAHFYESVAPGQEVEFRASLQRALDSVRQHPALGRVVDVGLGAIVLDQFPFKILYRVKSGRHRRRCGRARSSPARVLAVAGAGAHGERLEVRK